MADALRVVVLTPHDVAFDGPVVSARLPTETGQVGLRPGQEPLLLAVEPGLLLLRGEGEGIHLCATAGGLLRAGREEATLYTPFAVVGEEADAVLAALKEALAAPDGELVARRRLEELERRILDEVRQWPEGPRGSHGQGQP